MACEHACSSGGEPKSGDTTQVPFFCAAKFPDARATLLRCGGRDVCPPVAVLTGEEPVDAPATAVEASRPSGDEVSKCKVVWDSVKTMPWEALGEGAIVNHFQRMHELGRKVCYPSTTARLAPGMAIRYTYYCAHKRLTPLHILYSMPADSQTCVGTCGTCCYNVMPRQKTHCGGTRCTPGAGWWIVPRSCTGSSVRCFTSSNACGVEVNIHPGACCAPSIQTTSWLIKP